MGIVAGEETTVEVSAGTDVGNIMIKPDEISGSLVAIVQLDDGLAQVLFSVFCSHFAGNVSHKSCCLCYL